MNSPATDAASEPLAPLPADFSDRLSPMLVKELRQGLRTRTFTSAFILLQALLLFSTFVASSTSKANDVLDGFFWFFLSTILFLIQPLRGINALIHESKLNTLELILLTKLDALRIVTGKWASIVSQSALLVVAVLPYVVLRYFLGGVDVLNDLVYLAVLLSVSAMLTALTVGFSAFPSVILRGLLFVGAGIGASSIITVVMAYLRLVPGLAFGSSLSTGGYIASIVGMIFTSAFFTYYLLDMGAARIAPPSANHATRKRLLSLAVIILLFSLPLAGVTPEFSLWIAFIIAGIACIDALTEPPGLTAGVYSGFLFRRILPPAARYLFAPGWHTGVLYTLLLLALFAGFISTQPSIRSDLDSYGVLLGIGSVILFPLLLSQLFYRNSTQLMNQYVIMQCICTTVAAILTTAANSGGADWVLWTGCFIPHVAIAIMMDSSNSALTVSTICATVIVLTATVALGRARPLFLEMTRAYRIARAAQIKKSTPGS